MDNQKDRSCEQTTWDWWRLRKPLNAKNQRNALSS